MTSVYRITQLFKQESFIDTSVCIEGWVRTRRDSKAGLSFLQVSDGSCFSPIQVVIANTLENYQSDVLHLTAGCAVKVTGTLVASTGRGQSVEIQASKVEVVGWVENADTYPISAKHHTLEYLRDVAHLRPRTNTIGAVARLRHCVAQAIHQYFDQQGFIWVNTPIITASDCEGAGELFQVSTLDWQRIQEKKQAIDYADDFFGERTFLTVSGQLEVESYCCALSKVYTFGPTFRAENSNTSRHLAEFWMIEPEIAFANLDDAALLGEGLLKHIAKTVLAQRADDMQFFADRVDKECIARLERLVDSEFERIDYTKAIELLQQKSDRFEFPVEWGLDLQSEHERYLTEEYFEKPCVVINYPKSIKAFYMRVNDDEKTVAAMDVLVPGIGEIMGGSQREERLPILEQRIQECDVDVSHLDWYLDLRRYGSVPHAGFGMGFERVLNYITGLNNIRDVIPFPRVPGNAKF